jgi:pyridoxal phosphate enzyme (YggS family)
VSVAERVAGVRARIERAARESGRNADDVTLVAVSKTIPAEIVQEAVQAGVQDLGENRAQELTPKAEALAAGGFDVRWHFVGRLQRNKVHGVAPYVSLWQSVDRSEIADAIAGHAPGAAVLVQVNVGDEAQKGGCAVSETTVLIEHCRSAGLDVQGLMTVPPAEGDPRPWFAMLRQLVDDNGLTTCSMGMTGDFEAAISEGATMVRVGTAVFGPRPTEPDARR